jgi:hypothetical protein
MLISEIVKENNLPTASQLVSSDKDKGESSQDDEDDPEKELEALRIR